MDRLLWVGGIDSKTNHFLSRYHFNAIVNNGRCVASAALSLMWSVGCMSLMHHRHLFQVWNVPVVPMQPWRVDRNVNYGKQGSSYSVWSEFDRDGGGVPDIPGENNNIIIWSLDLMRMQFIIIQVNITKRPKDLEGRTACASQIFTHQYIANQLTWGRLDRFFDIFWYVSPIYIWECTEWN